MEMASNGPQSLRKHNWGGEGKKKNLVSPGELSNGGDRKKNPETQRSNMVNEKEGI